MNTLNSSQNFNKKFNINVVEGKYYLTVLLDDVEFEIDDLKQVVEETKRLGGQKLPSLIVCPPSVNTNADLLGHLSKNENNPYSLADAFVISSTSQLILSNFYMKVNKPERPTKFFKKEADALEWLKQFFVK